MSVLHDIVRNGRDIAKTTRARYLNDLNNWIAFAGDSPDNWTRQKAQDFYDHLIESRKLKPQSANRVMVSLQYASKWWAYRLNRPELDFARVQKAPAGDYLEKTALPVEDAVKLLEACRQNTNPSSLRDFALIVTGLETGMRRMSLISMLLERTYPWRPGSGDAKLRYPATFVLMKGSGDIRVPVPMSDTALLAIEPWKEWMRSKGAMNGPVFRALTEEIQRSGRSTVPSPTAFSEPAIGKMLDRRCEQAGIDRIYPHRLRHTFVTWRAAAGLAPHEIAAITGHTISGIGALAEYIDLKSIAEKVRNTTPQWLIDLVAK